MQSVVNQVAQFIGITFGTTLMIAAVVFWLSIVKFWKK